MKTILVVEDDKRINEIICDYFEIEEFKVISAFDGIEALDKFAKNKIDIVILDVMMPQIDGWTVCRKLRKMSEVIIVMLSARTEEDDKLMGFELGVDEYVTKPFSPKVLVARVKALINRTDKLKIKEDTNILKKGIITIDKLSYIVKIENEIINLTAKEYEILITMVEAEGNVFSRQSLIDRIWGYSYYGDGRVIDTNIKTLRKKLKTAAKYIVTVIGIGYKFDVE